MAIRITEDCINCGACEPECPNHAIYEGGVQWRYADGTQLSGQIALGQGLLLDAEALMPRSLRNTITSCPASAPNARAFMRSRNVRRSVQWIAVCLTRTTLRRRSSS